MTDAEDPVAGPPAAGETPSPPSGGGDQPAPPPAPAAGGGSTGLKVGGWILVGLGALLLVAGIALVVVHLTQRDKDGYYTSSSKQVSSTGYAITAEGLHLGDLPSVASDVIGRLRVTATSSNGRALFVGIARQNAVNGYLAGVARSEVTDVSGAVTYKAHAGGAPVGPPGREGFWQSDNSGSGRVTATWNVKGGNWTVVLMNRSAAPNVSAAVIVGAKTNLVLWVGLGVLLVGLIFGGAGGGMLWSSR